MKVHELAQACLNLIADGHAMAEVNTEGCDCTGDAAFITLERPGQVMIWRYGMYKSGKDYGPPTPTIFRCDHCHKEFDNEDAKGNHQLECPERTTTCKRGHIVRQKELDNHYTFCEYLP